MLRVFEKVLLTMWAFCFLLSVNHQAVLCSRPLSSSLLLFWLFINATMISAVSPLISVLDFTDG